MKARRALPKISPFSFSFFQSKDAFWGSGVPLCWWREGRAPQKAALGPFCTSRPSFCHCSGLVPRILGDVIFLWCCNLLAHFINTYAVDDNVSGSAQWRVWGAHTKHLQLQGVNGWLMANLIQIDTGLWIKHCKSAKDAASAQGCGSAAV